MNVQGKWTGTIIYGKEYRVHQNKEVYFDLDINQDTDQITGIAMDIGGFATNPDPAKIIGTVVGNGINFIKQYASRHTFKNGQTVIDKSRPGPEINYTGIYDESSNSFNGNWEITFTFKLFWLIPIRQSGGGTWSMRRK